MSHFYTLEGQGPWWLEADGENWDALQDHLVERPGRASSVTVILSFEGRREEASDLGHLGDIKFRVWVD